ncbi:endogenous retrovirus group 3 member 1 Env polyprotein-like [Salmo salar]|uniref:Endogenous retrovirus group 3 member 1 Env polyprotein-like n=1 Tax=Salmo salar TaxID=8030 RepID=A0ABM3EB24_SALSA|nr:endogenous retrovirus group 3 member 1 Env polyprotein-like [Salmo salar]
MGPHQFLIQKKMGLNQFRWCSVALICVSTGMLIRTVGCPLVGKLTDGEISPEPKGPMQAQSSGPEVNGNDRMSPESKGLSLAQSSGPEVDGNDRRSPEPKEPTQACSSGPEVDGNDRRSPEPKEPTQACSSGPEVDGNDRRSPEPKEPMQTCSNGLEVDGHRRRTALLGPHQHEDNLFLSRAEMVANKTSKENDCWVCGMGPVKVGAGLTLMGVPIGVNFTIALAGKIPFNTMTNNVKVYNQPNISYYLRPGNVSILPISVAGVMTAPWCIRGYGDHHLGELKCNCTMNLNGSNACNLTVIQENGQADKEPFKMWVDRHSTTLRGAPNGTYWLCGKMAYYSLPSNWGGTCTVGFVVTAMRTVPNNERDLMALFKHYKLPGMRRDKRSLADVTHAQAPASRFFGVFFSGYGVVCALDQIHDISRHREKIGNASRNALEQLNRELKELLKLSLQNREALDYLLAGQGGSCAIIGNECCIFVLPDHSPNVTDLATAAKKNPPKPEWMLATWLESLFGSWGCSGGWAAACIFCLVCLIIINYILLLLL